MILRLRKKCLSACFKQGAFESIMGEIQGFIEANNDGGQYPGLLVLLEYVEMRSKLLLTV